MMKLNLARRAIASNYGSDFRNLNVLLYTLNRPIFI